MAGRDHLARRRGTALGAVAALAVLSACAGEDQARSTATSTTAVLPAPDDGAAAEAALLADYRQAWAAMVAAWAAPADEPAPFEAWLADGALDTARRLTADLRDQGRVSRGDVELDPDVRLHAGHQAVIWDCVLDGGVVHDAATGAVVEEPNPEPHGYQLHLRRHDDRWRITETYLQEDACAAT